ncbi:MAG: hypothetical protein JSS53_03610, partial [Proteobacteria bacterium]|nr:hypothetical protein [Pseudomonadota bacterium]
KSKEKEEAPKRARVIQILKDTEEWKSESDFWTPSKGNRLKQVIWKYANLCAEASDGLSKDDSQRYKDRALRRLTDAYELSYTEMPGFKVKLFGFHVFRSKKYQEQERKLKASYERNQRIIADIYDAKISLKEFGLRSLSVLECAKETKQIDKELYSKLSEELSTCYLKALMQTQGSRDIEDILRLKYWWCSEALWKQYQSRRAVSSESKIEINIQHEWNEFNLYLSQVEEPLCKIQLPTRDEEKRSRIDQHALSQSMRGILRKCRNVIVSAHLDEEITLNLEESEKECQQYKEWMLTRYPIAEVNNAVVKEKSDATQGIARNQRDVLNNICNETLGVLQQLSEWKKWLLTYEAKGRDILFTVKYYSQVMREIEDGISTLCAEDIEAHKKAWSAHIDSEEKKLLSTNVSSQPNKSNDQSRNIIKGVFALLREILSSKTQRFSEQLKEYESLASVESQKPTTFEEEIFEAEMKRREAYIRKVVFEEGKQLIENPAKQNPEAKTASTVKIKDVVAEVSVRTTEVLDVEIAEMLEKSLIVYPFKMTPWMMRRFETMMKRVEGRKSFWNAWIDKISNQSEEMPAQTKVSIELKDFVSEDPVNLSLENKKLGDEILTIIQRCDQEIDEIRKNIENIILRKQELKTTKPDQLEEACARVRKKQYQAEEAEARTKKEQYQAKEAEARTRKEQYQSEEAQALLKKRRSQAEESQARVKKEQCRVEGPEERKARLALEAESAAIDSKSVAAAEKAEKRKDTVQGYDKLGVLGSGGKPLDSASSKETSSSDPKVERKR